MTQKQDLQHRITEKNEAAIAAFRRKDADAIAEGFLGNGSILVPNQPIATGGAAIAEAWSALIGLPGVEIDWGSTFVDLAESGELAYEIGAYRLSFDAAAARIEDKGKYVVVWKRESGDWKIAVDMFNSDLAPAS
jgi:ketosteroid isomerase-like protein